MGIEPAAPPILAAMVTASTTLLAKAIEWLGKRDSKSATNANEVVNEAYDKLHLALTDNSVKVLKLLKAGDYEGMQEIRRRLFSELQLPANLESSFDGEFRCRLEYLKNCGVITIAVGPTTALRRWAKPFSRRHADARTTTRYFLGPKPSLHPTCYSGLRPLAQAGELKR